LFVYEVHEPEAERDLRAEIHGSVNFFCEQSIFCDATDATVLVRASIVEKEIQI
jgi:hypothetical protein